MPLYNLYCRFTTQDIRKTCRHANIYKFITNNILLWKVYNTYLSQGPIFLSSSIDCQNYASSNNWTLIRHEMNTPLSLWPPPTSRLSMSKQKTCHPCLQRYWLSDWTSNIMTTTPPQMNILYISEVIQLFGRQRSKHV